MTRRAMEGDWVTQEGNRIVLVATAKEGLEGETELYRHFDAKGRLLYVGISLSTIVRLAQHKNVSHWMKRVARIDIERFPTRRMAEEAERRAIHDEGPECNVNGASSELGEML